MLTLFKYANTMPWGCQYPGVNRSIHESGANHTTIRRYCGIMIMAIPRRGCNPGEIKQVFHMKYARIILAAAAVLCLPSIAQSTPTTLLADDFDAATIGSIPAGWRVAKAVAGTNCTAQAGTPAGNKWMVIHDDNGAGSIVSNTISRTASFTPVTDRCTAQFDVMLSQTTAGFGMRLTNGDVATTLSNCATSITFEGNVAYAPNGEPGAVSYQTHNQTYVRSPLMVTYTANTWYTVRVEANVGAKFYKLFFGPKGGALQEITPTGGVQFMVSATGTQVSQIANIAFFTSTKDGDAPGDMTIDNVSVVLEGPETPSMANTIAMARLLDRGTKVSLTDKLAIADTFGGVFYIEDDGQGVERAAGIRVRSSTAVREGDRVDIIGRITQTSEGRVTAHTGEREIAAERVTVRSSGNPVFDPFLMRCADVGGGWFGPTELTAYGSEPLIKGVWPHNAWGDPGVSPWNPAESRYGPLNNVGLLVTVIGKVIDPTVYDMYGTNYDFYIDDGSLPNDGWFGTPTPEEEAFKPRGLRIRITDPAIIEDVRPLYHGDYVKITGIVGAIDGTELGRSTRNIRVVRPRKPEDIRIIRRQERYVKFDKQGNCLVGGKPFFPIGIFIYAWDSLVRPEVLAKGFNTVIYAVTPNDLDGLRDDGLMTIPYGTNDWLAMRDHPSILAWYLDDEPEGHGLTPQYERRYYERVREVDPTRPIGTAHFLWDSLWNYRFCDDYTMSDVYPLHRTNIWAMTDHIDRLHQIHGQHFPVWPAIQCFGGTEGYGIPSPTEVRAMTYMALAHNSKAILYFSYYPSIPDTWAEVGRLVQEMKALTPFYCLPSIEGGHGCSNGWVHTRLIRNGASGLLITVNVSSEAQTATITLPPGAPDTLNLPLEGGSIPVTGGSFTADYSPLQVHVYQWGPIPAMPE